MHGQATPWSEVAPSGAPSDARAGQAGAWGGGDDAPPGAAAPAGGVGPDASDALLARASNEELLQAAVRATRAAALAAAELRRSLALQGRQPPAA